MADSTPTWSPVPCQMCGFLAKRLLLRWSKLGKVRRRRRRQLQQQAISSLNFLPVVAMSKLRRFVYFSRHPTCLNPLQECPSREAGANPSKSVYDLELAKID